MRRIQFRANLPVALFSCTLLLAASAARAVSFYVSPTGSDDNPGTLAAPFKTITKARDAVRTVNTAMTEDIHVVLRGGNYPVASPIEFTPADGGKGSYRVIYEAYPNETPVLNGGVQVTDWTQVNGNVWKATLDRSTKLRSLIVNDKRAYMTKKTVTSKGG